MEETKNKDNEGHIDVQKSEEDSEDEIDFSKVKKFFQRKKKLEKEEEHIKDLKEKKEDIKDISTNLKHQEEKAKETDTLSESDDKEIKKEEKKLEDIENKITKAHEKNDEEDINIDFSKIKNFFKRKKGKVKKEEKEAASRESSEDEISIDWKKFVNFFKKNKYIVPVLLILIAISFSTFFRMYPANLPATDDWATSSVYNSIKSNIKDQINQQYPNLPDANKNVLVNSQFKQVLEQENQQINAQIKATSNYFKSKLQYTAENGKDYTYLLAIDPYLWYGYGKNYLECGHAGCDLREDGQYYTFRKGREGKIIYKTNLFSLIGVYVYKFLDIFSNIPLMYAFFLIPVILIGLAIIPAFFIGRKLGGNLGGFFAGMIIAINSALLSRTPAGFSDTDAINILFPLLIMWLFLETFYSENWKKIGIFSLLGGISFYIFSRIWKPHHIFDFLLVATVIYIGTIIIKDVIKKSSYQKIIKKIKKPLLKTSLFLGISLIFIILHRSINFIIQLFTRIIEFALMKEVAVTKLWPNVLTTVAEFNTVPLSQIINQMGGNLLFSFAILGIILSVLKKNKEGKRDIMYAALITIWFIGTAYGFTRGVRFAILMVPAFAVAFGTGIGIIYQHINKWISKELKINKIITSTILILLFCLLLVSPIKAAHRIALSEIPSYNDEWDESLAIIRNDAEDGIGYITTWWDFGHWFVAHGSRVTFDGGDQGERIHWVGKSLLTSNEKEAIGILRMLNCGQQKATHVLEKYLNNDTIKSIDVINNIIIEDNKKAREILKENGLSEEEIKEVLSVTHCEDLLPQYYIASEDMVGKAGVWGHFGSWDFKRAKMWQTVRNLDYSEGIGFLKEEFNLSEEKADNIYYEIQNTKADRWISGWPSYVSGLNSCSEKDNLLKCGNGLEVNLTNMNAYISTQQGKMLLKSLAFINNNKKFELKEYEGNTAPYSAALLPNGKSILMDPKLAGSMFTRLFFFDGYGLEHFNLLSDKRQITGGRIQVWKVSWEPNQPNIIEGLQEKTKVKQGDEVGVYYIGWTKEEGVFDSSIMEWQNLNITEKTALSDDYNHKTLTFEVGSGQVITGFDKGVIGMEINSTKIVEIPPEEAYGTDPNTHPLGNKTLFFKIKVIKIS